MFGLEMFLDNTDLSKTIDKHGTKRYHVLSYGQKKKFLETILVEQQPVLVERGLILAKNGWKW